jgi:hypothetical protein
MPTGPGREYTGSDDFMDLFVPDADWEEATSHLQVFKLYGEWVAYHATASQLQVAVEAIRSRGLALAVEMGPLDPPPECGYGIEGFAGTDEGRLIADRLLEAGARLDLIALDEPYYFASIYDGPMACHWDAAKVAAEVGEFVGVMRSRFPDVAVGDTEPTPHPTMVSTYTSWLETFRQVNGYDLAFLHLDIDWSRDTWAADAHEMITFGEGFGVPVGIIYTGNHSDPSDDRWVAIAGERIKEYEAVAGASPPHVLFQSWMDHPNRVLPESEPWTFTNLVLTYFTEPQELGHTPDQLAENVALGRPVSATSEEPGASAARAVDGDAGTHWSAGSGPTQAIELILDGPTDIVSVTLIPAQFPEGETTHRVLGLVGGSWVELDVVSGPTQDGIPITIVPDSPWIAVERLMVETVVSPSWVAWYEIEVTAATP